MKPTTGIRRNDAGTNSEFNERTTTKIDTAIIFITHDFGVVANIADRVKRYAWWSNG